MPLLVAIPGVRDFPDQNAGNCRRAPGGASFINTEYGPSDALRKRNYKWVAIKLVGLDLLDAATPHCPLPPISRIVEAQPGKSRR